MDITDVIGAIPYRIALAGGWIDQPFVSRHNPEPPGSMVVVSIHPLHPFLERAGMATGTRRVALERWGSGLPERDPAELVRELYHAENEGRADPSGSQDMVGLIYPGVSRIDYAAGPFPVHIQTNRDPEVAAWIERAIHIIAVAQRPEGYSPLGIQHLDPPWIRRLGASGRECFDAIVTRDLARLGASMNECMECWEAILPHTVAHPLVATDLKGILRYYQSRYPGAMYSGCGGGYIFVAADEPVPGSFGVKVRV